MLNSLHYELIKEPAIERLYFFFFHFHFHSCILWFWMERAISQDIFIMNCTVPLIWKWFCVFYFGTPKGTSGSEKHSFVRVPVLATVLAGRMLTTTWRSAAQILHPRLLIAIH